MRIAQVGASWHVRKLSGERIVRAKPMKMWQGSLTENLRDQGISEKQTSTHLETLCDEKHSLSR